MNTIHRLNHEYHRTQRGRETSKRGAMNPRGKQTLTFVNTLLVMCGLITYCFLITRRICDAIKFPCGHGYPSPASLRDHIQWLG